ncbi:MAG: VOC family protein [Bdellovibrionales bacterium]
MIQSMFLNLPVKDLKKTKEFFAKLGFEYNSKFTDDNAACMVINDNIQVMLLTEAFFKGFTKKPISDAKKTTEALMALSTGSRAEVDTLIKKAVAAGGRIYAEPSDLGFMYQHGFEDLDGHQWEVFYMNEAEFPQK